MLFTSGFARRLLAAIALASIAHLGFSPNAAMADGSEHDAVLAAIARTIQDAPEELGLKVNFSVVESYSTKDLKTLLASLPTNYKIILDSGDDIVKPAPAAGQVSAAAAPTTGCKTASGKLIFTGGVTNADLWYFQVSVRFCWDYGRRTITSIETAELQGHIYGPGTVEGWHYRGPHQGSPVNTPFKDVYGIDHYETYAQALFELCPLRLDCSVESNPWIRVSTFRDGSSSASKGGEK